MKHTFRFSPMPGTVPSKTPKLLEYEASWVTAYRPRYAILERPKRQTHRIVIASDKLMEITTWMETHKGRGHEAYVVHYSTPA